MLQVGNIVMVDRHVVRKALRGTSAVWKIFFVEIQNRRTVLGVSGSPRWSGGRVVMRSECELKC